MTIQEPLLRKLQILTTTNQEQASLIAAQERILTDYERRLDRQSSRLLKCLWAIGLLSLGLIVALIAR